MTGPNATIRPAGPQDHSAIWQIIEPIIRAGESYTLPRDIQREAALAHWLQPGNLVFVAVEAEAVAGAYYLRTNALGGGSHVANCGYATAGAFSGQGVGRAMAAHSLETARASGFLAMQFNAVVSTNVRAVRLWESMGFITIGRSPRAFRLPSGSFADLLIMHREL